MKRLYYLLLALPLAFFASCDNDDDLPDVSITVDMSGGMEYDNSIYVVQGDTLHVDAVNVKSNDGKQATLGATTYYWDTFRVGTVVLTPFTASFATDEMPVGNHLLQIQTNVYQVDKSPAVAVMSYKVAIVESAADIPGDATPLSNTPSDLSIKAQ